MARIDWVGITVVDGQGNGIEGATFRVWSGHGLLSSNTNGDGYAEIYVEGLSDGRFKILQWQVVAPPERYVMA